MVGWEEKMKGCGVEVEGRWEGGVCVRVVMKRWQAGYRWRRREDRKWVEC